MTLNLRIAAYPVAVDGNWKGAVAPCDSLNSPEAKSWHVRSGAAAWNLKFDSKETAKLVHEALNLVYHAGYEDARREIRSVLGIPELGGE